MSSKSKADLNFDAVAEPAAPFFSDAFQRASLSISFLQGNSSMRLVLLGMVACVSVLSIGCGGAAGPADPQAQVSGTATNNGKPITLDSLVIFYNKDKGLTLTGVVDSLGKYSLTAADPKVGVPVGRYEVSIKPPVPLVVEVSPSSPDYMKMMQSNQGANSVPAAAKSTSAADIPEKFNDPRTSGLVFEVKQGPNTFDLDLSKL